MSSSSSSNTHLMQKNRIKVDEDSKLRSHDLKEMKLDYNNCSFSPKRELIRKMVSFLVNIFNQKIGWTNTTISFKDKAFKK